MQTKPVQTAEKPTMADLLCLRLVKEQQVFERQALNYRQQRQTLWVQDLKLELAMLQEENDELAGENQDLYLQLQEIQDQIGQMAEQSQQLSFAG